MLSSQQRRSGGQTSNPRAVSRAGGVRVSVQNRELLDKNHTIVLIQFGQNVNTRTYHDFETETLALEGVLKIFEQKLKLENPAMRNITYDIKDLYNYIDGITDMSCLVLDTQQMAYVPHSKDWIKQSLLAHLKTLAQQQQTS